MPRVQNTSTVACAGGLQPRWDVWLLVAGIDRLERPIELLRTPVGTSICAGEEGPKFRRPKEPRRTPGARCCGARQGPSPMRGRCKAWDHFEEHCHGLSPLWSLRREKAQLEHPRHTARGAELDAHCRQRRLLAQGCRTARGGWRPTHDRVAKLHRHRLLARLLIRQLHVIDRVQADEVLEGPADEHCFQVCLDEALYPRKFARNVHLGHATNGDWKHRLWRVRRW
eukprot:2288889-Prymnesium_polylepis.2